MREICPHCKYPSPKEFDMEHLSSSLKDVRLRLGYTLRDVESKTGISNAYISQIETGKIKSPSLKIIRKLFECYGINIKVTR